jgi:4-amino-4-deoxy-L-arabinose transferase-like glycosyltransferase
MYERVPQMGNLEEMLFAWSGIYLIETGVPISWSTLDYPKRATYFKGELDYQGGPPKAGVTLRKPWLDEPPVFSLLVGWFAHIYNADKTDIIPPGYIRMPVVIIGAITSIFVFLIARLASGYWMGILSMLLYGTIPVIVIGSRLAVPENLIALLFAIAVYLILKFEIKPKLIYLLPIPLLAGIAGLSKPTGFFITPLFMYFAFLKKFYKAAVYMFLATLFFIGLFILYGVYYDAEIFWQIVSIQGFRPVGFGSLGWFLISPGFDHTGLKDSFYIFCLVSAMYFIFSVQDKMKRIVVFSFVYWVIIVMLSGGEGDMLAWYRYPTFPLLAIIGAWGLEELVKRANFLTTFLAAGLLMGNRLLLVNAFHPNVSPSFYRYTFSALMIPALLQEAFKKEWLIKLNKLVIIGIIATGIYINVVYVYNAYTVTCQGAECLFGPTTFLSTLHFPIIWRLFSY